MRKKAKYLYQENELIDRKRELDTIKLILENSNSGKYQSKGNNINLLYEQKIEQEGEKKHLKKKHFKKKHFKKKQNNIKVSNEKEEDYQKNKKEEYYKKNILIRKMKMNSNNFLTHAQHSKQSTEEKKNIVKSGENNIGYDKKTKQEQEDRLLREANNVSVVRGYIENIMASDGVDNINNDNNYNQKLYNLFIILLYGENKMSLSKMAGNIIKYNKRNNSNVFDIEKEKLEYLINRDLYDSINKFMEEQAKKDKKDSRNNAISYSNERDDKKKINKNGKNQSNNDQKFQKLIEIGVLLQKELLKVLQEKSVDNIELSRKVEKRKEEEKKRKEEKKLKEEERKRKEEEKLKEEEEKLKEEEEKRKEEEEKLKEEERKRKEEEEKERKPKKKKTKKNMNIKKNNKNLKKGNAKNTTKDVTNKKVVKYQN